MTPESFKKATPEDVHREVAIDFKRRRLKYEDVGERTGYTRYTIASMMSNKNYFTLKMAYKLSEVFGYNIEYLTSGEGTLMPLYVQAGYFLPQEIENNNTEFSIPIQHPDIFLLSEFINDKTLRLAALALAQNDIKSFRLQLAQYAEEKGMLTVYEWASGLVDMLKEMRSKEMMEKIKKKARLNGTEEDRAGERDSAAQGKGDS